VLHTVLLPLRSCARCHPFGGRGEEDPVVNILLNFFFVLLIKRETNFFFVLLIKRETRPHYMHLPFHKMRGMHSYRASPFKLVPPHLLSLVFTSFSTHDVQNCNTIRSPFSASSFIQISWHGCPRVTPTQGGAGNGEKILFSYSFCVVN
jgi:hypothetical protein